MLLNWSSFGSRWSARNDWSIWGQEAEKPQLLSAVPSVSGWPRGLRRQTQFSPFWIERRSIYNPAPIYHAHRFAPCCIWTPHLQAVHACFKRMHFHVSASRKKPWGRRLEVPGPGRRWGAVRLCLCEADMNPHRVGHCKGEARGSELEFKGYLIQSFCFLFLVS